MSWTVQDQARINSNIRGDFKRARRQSQMRADRTRKPRIKRADPGGCQFLIQGAGVQAECGKPATHEGLGRNTLLYCDDHAAWLQPHVRPINP